MSICLPLSKYRDTQKTCPTLLLYVLRMSKVLSMSNEPDTLLAVTAAAKRVGVTAQTLRRWQAMGLITARRTPGGQRRFRVGDLEALVSAENAQIG